MKDNNCVFCKIVKGEIPAIKIWEDKDHLVFLDMKPINPGHLLVIPKNHTDYVFDLENKDYSKLMLKAKEIAKDLKSKIKSKRIGMVVEGFGVPHVHVHLIPINEMHELNPERAKMSSKEELEKIAKLWQ
jgi:histidine triad (HIT) family protein